MTELNFLSIFFVITSFWVIVILVIVYFMNGRK